MQKANFLPQIVFEILKFRKICNLIGLEYFQLQLKNYIFHSHEVFIDSHRWCINLKPKKSHWWTKSFFKICIADFFFQSTLGMLAALQIRANQRSIIANLWQNSNLPCNDHCDRWLFQENFFLLFSEAAVRRHSPKKIAIFTGKHLCWSYFFIKFIFQPCPKRDFNTGDFNRVKIAKFLRTDFFMKHLRWLLLSVWS